jgi:hypothetical protein
MWSRWPQTILMQILIFTASSAFSRGIPVRHLIGVNDSPDSLLTGGICPYVYSTNSAARCSLTHAVGDTGAQIEMNAVAKYDEDAYNRYNELLNKPNEELVQKIFSEEKYNAASGIVTLSSFFRRTEISFTPIRLVQTYLINNPVFPEVHYAAAQDSIIRVSHVFQLSAPSLNSDTSPRPGAFLFGVQPYLLQRSRVYIDADLSDVVAGEKTKEKITETHADANLAMRYMPGLSWWKGITLQLINVNGNNGCKKCDQHKLDIDLDTMPNWRASIDFGGIFPVGAFIVGLGVERQLEPDPRLPVRALYSAVYKLTSFGFYASFTDTIRRVGFLYEGDLYQSGIIYSNEQQVNALRFERKNEAFLVLGCNF